MYAKYFTPSELICPCCGKGADQMDSHLLTILDSVREEFGIPLKINSGFRCKQQNDFDGGKPDSAHLKGKAVDISCKTSNMRMVLVCLFCAHGVKRIGIGKTFIHVDVDDSLPQNVMWLY